MTPRLFLPPDAVTGRRVDFDLAADFLELAAFFSDEARALTSDLANEASIGAAEDHADLDDEMSRGEEEIVSGAVERIEERRRVLGGAYPFHLDGGGDVLTCDFAEGSLGQAAYVLSLVLSNLQAASPVLGGSDLHPDDGDVRKLREYFQYFATAALAAEIQGDAWSFGFPRPDGSPFLEKLAQIWRGLRDGSVDRQRGAPRRPKDVRVDVFAARRHPDGLPGFLLAAAQVATGKDMREKSLKGRLGAFRSRWFAPHTGHGVHRLHDRAVRGPARRVHRRRAHARQRAPSAAGSTPGGRGGASGGGGRDGRGVRPAGGGGAVGRGLPPPRATGGSRRPGTAPFRRRGRRQRTRRPSRTQVSPPTVTVVSVKKFQRT